MIGPVGWEMFNGILGVPALPQPMFNNINKKKKMGKPLFGSQKVIFPSFGSQNKIFPSFYQSYYNFSFIRLTKVNFSTILSIFCQFFHHSIKVFFSLFRRNFYRWKKKFGWYFLRKNGVIFFCIFRKNYISRVTNYTLFAKHAKTSGHWCRV